MLMPRGDELDQAFRDALTPRLGRNTEVADRDVAPRKVVQHVTEEAPALLRRQQGALLSPVRKALVGKKPKLLFRGTVSEVNYPAKEVISWLDLQDLHLMAHF
jgi:hypothetical protein